MTDSSALYEELNRKWKATCRILLGGEAGELLDFATYLSQYVAPLSKKKSFLSGKETFVSQPNFSRHAAFISNDEFEAYEKAAGAPFSINQVKDIDSLLSAISERVAYSGNVVTGNSKFISESNIVADCTFVFRSSDCYGSTYLAYTSNSRLDECLFGCDWTGESKFLVTSYDTHKLARCMETIRCFTSSDCYYAANLEGCANCLFSFNQRSRRNLIGNLEFQKGEFAKLRGKLIGEILETLRSKKSVPSIVDIMRD